MTIAQFKDQRDYYRRVFSRKQAKDKSLVERIDVDESVLEKVDKEIAEKERLGEWDFPTRKKGAFWNGNYCFFKGLFEPDTKELFKINRYYKDDRMFSLGKASAFLGTVTAGAGILTAAIGYGAIEIGKALGYW